MGYSRASKNLIYKKMHQDTSMQSKMPTPFQVLRGMGERQSANIAKGVAKLGYKLDKATLGRLRK